MLPGSLRDLLGKNELARAKLNEPLIAYHIEAGSFDAIQMSLTDPINALRLKQAIEFFDRNEPLIRRTAMEHDCLMGVIQVIDRLTPRVRVSSGQYVKARIVQRGHGAKSWMVDGAWQAMYLIQELGSRAVSNISTIPNHVPQIPTSIGDQVIGILRAGDVIVTRKENALTNYFLPGYWPHAALYVGKQRVIEALKDGVRERGMDSPLGNDALAIIRPRLSESSVQQGITRARAHVGSRTTSISISPGATGWFAPKWCIRGFDGLEGIRFQLSRRAGRQTLSAEDLLRLAIDQRFLILSRCTVPSSATN